MTAKPHPVFRALVILWALLTCAEAIQTVKPGEPAGPLQEGGESRQISVNIGGADTVKTDEEIALEKSMVSMLDVPLLFAKRHSYTGIHIYDTFYKWPGGGGGGLYILENPAAPRSEWKIRALINETTPGTLGTGVYTHPDISPDAGKVIFCYKNSADACTAIYEINIDGTNLHQLTDPSGLVGNYHGVKSGMHDISPTYLPDGRIVFLSTRPRGLVPCANEGVSILHVMNADGSDIHPCLLYTSPSPRD